MEFGEILAKKFQSDATCEGHVLSPFSTDIRRLQKRKETSAHVHYTPLTNSAPSSSRSTRRLACGFPVFECAVEKVVHDSKSKQQLNFGANRGKLELEDDLVDRSAVTESWIE